MRRECFNMAATNRQSGLMRIGWLVILRRSSIERCEKKFPFKRDGSLHFGVASARKPEISDQHEYLRSLVPAVASRRWRCGLHSDAMHSAARVGAGLRLLKPSNGSELPGPQMSNHVNFSYCGNWARVNQKPLRLITISSNASRFHG